MEKDEEDEEDEEDDDKEDDEVDEAGGGGGGGDGEEEVLPPLRAWRAMWASRSITFRPYSTAGCVSSS